MRKLFTVALSLAMVLSMSAAVFAAGSSDPANPALTNSITIEKNLKVSNPNLTSVDGPGLTMNYAIAPVAPAEGNGGTTITDTASPAHTGTVHQGPAAGVTLSASSISWPIGTAVDASAAGADNVKSITANVDLTKFSVPGIYRYQLTETVGTDTSNIGAEGETRYIDVYIANDTTGLKVSGVVMHNGTTENGKPAQKKTFGDETFETVNITLQKTVSGNMADRNNQFQFAGTVTDNARYFYAKKAEAPAADNANKIAGAAAGSAVSTTLAHNEMYYISGLSHEAAVTYTETNNTQDVYQTSITGGTASAASAVAAGATKAMASTDVDNAGAVVFNNALEEVSPTGVIMRFGPYIGMIVIAAALVLMNRKAKTQR